MYSPTLEKNKSIADIWHEVADLNNLALLLEGQELAAQAIETLQEALSYDETNVVTLTRLGQLYEQQGNLQAAIPYMLRAYDASRDLSVDNKADPELSMAMGRLYMQSGQHRSAYRKFSEARTFSSHKAVALEGMRACDHAQAKPRKQPDIEPADSQENSMGMFRTVSPELHGAHIVIRTPRPG